MDFFDILLARRMGGGGGTTNYTDLENKPQINGVTLVGNKSSAELKLPYAETSYIELANGKREYLSTTVPTGTIPTGSVGMGFDEGVFTYKSGAKVSEGEPNLTYGKQFSFYANGQNLTDYTIYGADGGVGDRTANLFDYTKTDDIIANSFINQSGVIVTSDEYYISYPIEVNVGETYTWKFNTDTGNSHTAPTVGFYDSSDNLLSTAHHDSAIRYFSFEVPTNCAYIRASVFTKDKNVQQEAMLNEGSTPLPYEPYGYKIPVICGNKTTNIYIDSPLDDGDSIDYTTSQVAIPTVDGANNLICDTTVQPSKVSLAYTGWHSDLDEINSRLAAIEQAIANGGA